MKIKCEFNSYQFTGSLVVKVIYLRYQNYSTAFPSEQVPGIFDLYYFIQLWLASVVTVELDDWRVQFKKIPQQNLGQIIYICHLITPILYLLQLNILLVPVVIITPTLQTSIILVIIVQWSNFCTEPNFNLKSDPHLQYM